MLTLARICLFNQADNIFKLLVIAHAHSVPGLVSSRQFLRIVQATRLDAKPDLEMLLMNVKVRESSFMYPKAYIPLYGLDSYPLSKSLNLFFVS